jgi:hypothetical protein
MSNVLCTDCDSELNQLYAFERQNDDWKAHTHRLWYCPVCCTYLAPNTPVTTRRGHIDLKRCKVPSNQPAYEGEHPLPESQNGVGSCS